MLREYYNDENTLNKNYGIYEYFKKEKSEQLKTYGAIYDDKYIFCDDIYDHRGTIDNLEQKYGRHSIWFSPYGEKCDENELEFYGRSNSGENFPSIFQYETILGILDELKKYSSEKNELIKVTIASTITKQDDVITTDIDYLINLINENINTLKTPKKGISNLKIFKLLKKENKKRK